MKSSQLVKDGNISIVCETKKDVDRVLRIATKKKWHWVSGNSAASYRPPCYRKNKMPEEKVCISFWRERSWYPVTIGYRDVEPNYKGNRSVAWFEKNFAVRHRT